MSEVVEEWDRQIRDKLASRFQILRRLGRGGKGAVYKVRQSDGAIRAVKVFLEPLTEHHDLARFRREAIVGRNLDHPQLLKIYDTSDVLSDGLHYLVMEFVDGIDLRTLVLGQPYLPIATACELIRQASVGLAYAHDHDLIHRDIKPENLLLARSGMVKILDLGLAFYLANRPAGYESVTLTFTSLGTPDYMAPEQFNNAKLLPATADIYSLGCTFYFVLAKMPPFDRHSTHFSKMIAHASEPSPALTEKRRDLPPQLIRIIERMMHKEPARRFQSANEIAYRLEPFCRGCKAEALAALVPPAAPDGDA